MSEPKADLDEVILDWYLQELASQGWRVVSRTATTAQVVRTRVWNRRGLLIALALIAIGGVLGSPWLIAAALFVLILVIVDYVRQHSGQNTVTAAQAREAARLLEGGR